jgi:hypothetical protein
VQDVDLLLAHLVQRDQRLVVGDGAPVAGGLRAVGADLQRDHDRQLRQVEDHEQQRPRRLVEADDVAEEQPHDDADRDAEEYPHGPAHPVDPVGDLVEQAGAADLVREDQLGVVVPRVGLDVLDPVVQFVLGVVDRAQRRGVGVRARDDRRLFGGLLSGGLLFRELRHADPLYREFSRQSTAIS